MDTAQLFKNSNKQTLVLPAELEYGVYKSQKQQQNRKALATFLIPLQIISYLRFTNKTNRRFCPVSTEKIT